MNPTKRILGWLAVVAALFACAAPVQAQPKPNPPNILVIWGDDIGWQKVSAYGLGTMGYTAAIGELMNAHLKTLADFPPVQGGQAFDMSSIVQEFIGRAKQ